MDWFREFARGYSEAVQRDGFHLAWNFFVLVVCILFAFFTYKPFYSWYDKQTFHYKTGFYIFGPLVILVLMYLSIGFHPSSLSDTLSTLGTLIIVLLFMAVMREKRYKDKGKENVVKVPPPPSSEPEPEAPKGPTAEEKVQQEIDEMLRKNREA